MLSIANVLGVSIDAVTYFMRRNNMERRSFSEDRRLRFANKPPSFVFKKTSKRVEELKILGSMLYWGEGYKGNDSNPANLVDFANSDPSMVGLFMEFLRSVFALNESKFRVLLYCYSNQDLNSLVRYWSGVTRLSPKSFSKPFVKKCSDKTNGKMKYGLVHIRYYDKKLLLEIKKMINSYRDKYLRRSDSGYSSGL